jgi:hypothetical protein
MMVVRATLFKEEITGIRGIPFDFRVPFEFLSRFPFSNIARKGRLLVRYAPQNLTPLFCTTRSDQAALDLVLFVDLKKCFGF